MMFDWCANGRHDECHREYEIFFVDTKTNKPVFTGEMRYCQCTKRGCACHVPAKDRVKIKNRKRKS